MCVAHLHSAAQWLAGNQRDSSMNKQGAYLPLPPSFFQSAWTCSANTNHSCSLVNSPSHTHSLFSWLGTGGIHSEQLCSWPWPPRHACLPVAHTNSTQTHHVCRRTPSSCCGVKGGMPASCMCGCGCACVPQPAASPALHPVRVCAHICVLIFLEAHG